MPFTGIRGALNNEGILHQLKAYIEYAKGL